MAGYWNDPERTKSLVTRAGWFRTGDIAVVDHKQSIQVVGRIQDLILDNGYQILPEELESRILTHKGVRDVAVVGEADEAGHHTPKAFVVRRENSIVTSEEILAHVASAVAPHKRIRAVAFIRNIPRCPAGRIIRSELKATE
jgi:acyl-coenzyme A synthetase/AMP-(fatty) acid ligase